MADEFLNEIRPIELVVEDTYSFKFLKLTEKDFYSESITAILGRNEDQLSDNGAGKSNLVKCQFLIRYGKDINGKKIEKVIRRGAEGWCGQEIFWKNGRKYRIKRFRDWTPKPGSPLFEEGEEFHKTKKNTGVKFYVDDILWTGSSEETQTYIESVLGQSAELFLASVILKQNGGSPFLSASEEKRQKLITEIQNLGPFTVGEKKIQTIFRDHNKKIDSLRSHIDVQSKMIDKKLKEIPVLKQKAEEFEVKREQKLAEHRKEISPLLKKLKEDSDNQQEKKDVLPLKSIVNTLEEDLKDARISFEKSRSSQALDDLRVEKQRLEIQKNTLSHQIETLRDGIASLERSGISTTDLDLKLQGILQECDRIINEREISDIEAKTLVSQKLSGEISAHLKTIEISRSELNELEHSLSCPTCKRMWEGEALKEKEIEIQSVKNRISDLNVSLQKDQSDLASVNLELDAHKKWLKKQTFLANAKSLEIQIAEIKTRAQMHGQKKSELLMKESELINTVNLSLKVAEQEKSEIERIDSTLGDLKKLIQELELKVQKARSDVNDAERFNAQLEAQGRETESLKARIEAVKSLGLSLKEQPNAFHEAIEMTQKDLKELEHELKIAQENLQTFELDSMYIDFWKEGMSEAGIKSFCADDFLIDLNESANYYLDRLYEGALRIEFQSQKTNTKGVVSNEITPKFYLCGEETDFGEISGGEEGRIELAVNLAIADVAEMRSGVRSAVRFLDEPFDGICSTGQLKCLSVLKQVAQEKGRKFFLISHDPALQNMCKHRIVIRKKNKVSEIVENNIGEASSA